MGLPLAEAIYSKFTATSALTTAIPGGLSREHYEPGSTIQTPYAIYSIITSTYSPTFPSRRPYDVDVQFDVIGDTDEECYGGIAAIATAYTDAAMTMGTGNGTNTDTRPTGPPIPMPFDEDGGWVRDEEAEHPYRWTQTFRFHIEPA